MPRYDFRSPRLFVDAPLGAGALVPLAREQAHYLGNVLRLGAGDAVLAFNGRDGEWHATLAGGKKLSGLTVSEQTRTQPAAGDVYLLFAPLKHARLDYMVQKAVELGASRLVPILTRHTQVARVNLERMRANAIEAAEQCGVLAVPDVAEPVAFSALAFGLERLVVFCDEAADVADPVTALRAATNASMPPVAVVIGPEGGFTEEERAQLLRAPSVVRLALGPRILRADTAAVAALTVVQAVLGDWRG
ncbi:MAG: 16S rRNA (uracil(1498)-N(3))-methyltransferase [Pseudolabrys sp.]|nr:16S rRNA (uracil(1498)-N(3))-methyltransferase [Pseudolabrys sp.]